MRNRPSALAVDPGLALRRTLAALLIVAALALAVSAVRAVQIIETDSAVQMW